MGEEIEAGAGPVSVIPTPPGLQVSLAPERVLVFAERVPPELAETRAWTRRVDAFGTLAKMSGLLSRPKDEEFELVYRERRLQPFWRVSCSALSEYERGREHVLKVAAEVTALTVGEHTFPAVSRSVSLAARETCREETKKEPYFDGLTKAETPALASYLNFDAVVATPESLADLTSQGWVVVPPQIKASTVVREVLAKAINKIEADRVIEESVRFEAVDLYYRPVHAFKYRRQHKEAVVEVDGLTGEAKPGGATFEQYLGKVIEPRFLLDMTVEAANLFIPGARLATMLVEGGIKTAKGLSSR